MKVNAYDFDGTIYDGDSSIDFYKFCLKKKKSICKYWIKQLWFFGLYILGIKSKTEMKEVLFCYLKEFDQIDPLVEEFWKTHFAKIKPWYLKKDHSNDIIISASPQFLLSIPCKKLQAKDLIASEVDSKTGIFLKENCHGLEKVKRLKEKYPDVIVEEMYTDSSVDLPMIECSKKGYMVDKNNIVLYQDYQPSLLKKIKHTFLTPKFFRFLFVGCLNTINGILLSYFYSLIISNAILAFVIGYLTSLVISYLLNSYITFRDKKLTIMKLIKFCISYIPNFIIQLICVYIIIDLLHLYKLIAYIIAAVIGIPITYFALLLFPFKEKNNFDVNRK